MTSRKSGNSAAVLLALMAGSAVAVTARARQRATRSAAAYPPLGRFVSVAGRRVHYVQAGTGPDLVLLHGASGSLREFTFGLIDRLSARYRVTAFDRPGLGYTDPDPQHSGVFDSQAESPAAQAHLLARAARAIGLRDEIVLGHSYGGAVAMAWALDHAPGAAVIVSGATQPWPGALGPLQTLTGTSIGGGTLVPLISAFATPRFVHNMITTVFAPQTPPEGYLDYVGTSLALRTPALRANVQQVRHLHAHLTEMAPRYAGVTLPVEVLHGTCDGIVPLDVHSAPLAAQVPNAHFTRLEGIGHMPHQVAEADVVAAVDRAAARMAR